jgi:hypothetical protein
VCVCVCVCVLECHICFHNTLSANNQIAYQTDSCNLSRVIDLKWLLPGLAHSVQWNLLWVFKKFCRKFARHWWLTPVILATLEREIRKIAVWNQFRQILYETLSWKYLTQKRDGGVAQGVGLEFKPQYWEKKKKVVESQKLYAAPQFLHPLCCHDAAAFVLIARTREKNMTKHAMQTTLAWNFSF